MNIANLSPAERMKAFGLVGIIIVVLFFAVHTLLGSVSPKKPGKQDGAAAQGAVPGPPAPAAAAPAAGKQAPLDAGEAFPMDKAFETSRLTNAEVDRTVSDPFVQIHDEEDKRARSTKRLVQSEPRIDIRPSTVSTGGPRGWLPGLGQGTPTLGGGGRPAEVLKPVSIEPEIRVVGIVHGDSPLATLSVGGATIIARPGDPLAKGYRLLMISEEGVTIRHVAEIITLRVGTAINTPEQKQ